MDEVISRKKESPIYHLFKGILLIKLEKDEEEVLENFMKVEQIFQRET